MSEALGAVLQRLHEVTGVVPRGSNGTRTARCPAHEDRNPSLSVSTGHDGRVLLKCHAGCETADVLTALNLTVADLFTEPLPAKAEESITYPYTDADGRLLFEVVRRPGKQFRQRRPDGRGGWEWSLGDTPRVLYRLPAVLQAAAAGGTVYVVEGEKDVAAAERAGAVATCNPGGAGKWRPEHSQALTGAHVVIVADRDTPGRDHAAQVAASLTGHAASVRVVEPVAGKDLADHLATGRSLDELVEPEQATERQRNRLVTGGAFIFDAPDTTPSLWGRGSEVLWPEGEPLYLTGPPGVGKTTLGGQLVAGRLGLLPEVLGYPVTPGRRVLYLACDRPKQISRALRRLLATIATREQLDERLTVWQGPPFADVARQPTYLLELANEAQADTIVVDSLKDVAVKLTDDEVGQGLNRAFQHCVAEGVEVLGFHHQTKRGGGGAGKPNTLADVYGSAWITAGAGSVLLLWGNAGDPIVELSHLKQPAEAVGPLRVLHDHDTGISTVYQGTDLLTLLKAGPMTPPAVAQALYGATTASDTEKARRKLEHLVRDGHAVRLDPPTRGGAGGGSRGITYALKATHAATHAPSPAETTPADPRRPTNTDETPGQATHDPTHATHAPSDPRATPPIRGARRESPPKQTTCHVCQQPTDPTLQQTCHPACCPDNHEEAP